MFFETHAVGGASRYVFDSLPTIHKISPDTEIFTTPDSFSSEQWKLIRETLPSQRLALSGRPWVFPRSVDGQRLTDKVIRRLREVISIPLAVVWMVWILGRKRPGRVVVFNGGYPGSRKLFAIAATSAICRFRTILFALSEPLAQSGPKGSIGRVGDTLIKKSGVEIVVNSHTQKATFLRRRSLESERIRVCRNGIGPWPETKNETGVDDLGSSVPVRLVVIGRLDRLKGVDTAIRSLCIPPLSYRRVHLSIVGEGPSLVELKELVGELRLEEKVEFLGRVESVSYDFLKGFDVGLMPSTWEGLPYVLLEMMGAGLPVAVSSVGAVPEILGPLCEELVFVPGDAAGLSTIVDRLISDPEFRTSVAVRGRARVEQEFSLASMNESLAAVLR